MVDFLLNAFLFIGMASFFVVIMLLYVFFNLKEKSIKSFMEYFLNTETGGGRGALFGIGMAVIAVTIIAGIVTLIYSARANSEPVRYFDKTIIFAGLERTFKQSPQCYSDGVDDRLTSSLGVSQQIIGYKYIDLMASYQHHSCAVNRDWQGYDAVGFKVTWTIE